MNLEVAKSLEAVWVLLRRKEPAKLIARRFEISEGTLYRLRDAFLEAGKEGLARRRGKWTGGNQELQRLQTDLAERDRVIGKLTIANRKGSASLLRGPASA